MPIGVRNVTTVHGNSRPIPVQMAIPPTFSPAFKIELVNDSDTYDVSDLIETGEYTDGVTDNVGIFYFKIVDPDQTLSTAINNFDNIKIYLDYGKTATTLRFNGVIEKSPREDIYFKVSGRSIAMTVMGRNIIYEASNKKRSDVLIEILEKHSPEVDISGIEEDTTLVNVNYSEIPFQNIVEELSGKHHDFYIDHNLKAHYFVKGSKLNSTEAVSANYNHISTEDYGADSEETVTQVRIYGKKADNIPIFSTSTSSTAHTNGIIKEVKINDSSAVTPEQTKERADAEYDAGVEIPNVGSVTSLLLPTLAPGEKLFMGVPLDKIDPDYYTINSFIHQFPILQTKLVIQQRELNIPKIIKSSFRDIEGVSEQDNPQNLDSSIIYDYQTEVNSDGVVVLVGDALLNSGTFENVELDIGSTGVGVLKTISGETGTWTSEEISTDTSVTFIAIRESSTDLAGTKFFVSLDRGVTFKEIGSSSGNFRFDNPQNSIILKAEIKSSNTRITKIGIYYSES